MKLYYVIGGMLFICAWFGIFVFGTCVTEKIKDWHDSEIEKLDDETTNLETVPWIDENEYLVKMQPQDMFVSVDGVAIMSFAVDHEYRMTGIKILTQDTGYYSEDGITYYLCINGIKVEGSEFCVDK